MKNKKEKNRYLGTGLVIGMLIGVLLIEKFGYGSISIGMLVGMMIGALIDKKNE